MPIRNTTHGYGLIAILLHWITAIAVMGLFAFGLWMTGLDYYDPWYRRAPALHKSIGILLSLLLLMRLGWRLVNPRPAPLENHATSERLVASIVHPLLYLLLFATMLAGYLISTADGRSIPVFGWFDVPATLSGIDNQEDIAGEIHLVLAITLVSIAALHALAALKHHFLDRDRTLLRMLGR